MITGKQDFNIGSWELETAMDIIAGFHFSKVATTIFAYSLVEKVHLAVIKIYYSPY